MNAKCHKTRIAPIGGFACVLAGLVLNGAAAEEKATPQLTITDLHAASGKTYTFEKGGFAPGALQFIDRDYTFNYVPQVLKGATTIKTAGDDKFIREDQVCVQFRVNAPVTVYVAYGDKLRILPKWLQAWTNTRYKLTRKDTNPATLKGIFTLFANDYPAGLVTLNGNLSKEMAADEEFQRMKGSTFCMYSVVVVPRSSIDLDAKVARLARPGTTVEQVIRLLGEPKRYRWGEKTFQKATLPDTYVMQYPAGVGIVISGGIVSELRAETPGTGFIWQGKLRLGSSLEEVLQVLGPPSKTVVGGSLGFADGVLYKDINGSQATPSGLFDLRAGAWSEELCAAFGVERRLLPPVLPAGRRADWRLWYRSPRRVSGAEVGNHASGVVDGRAGGNRHGLASGLGTTRIAGRQALGRAGLHRRRYRQ